jgi:hypothetical protein
VDPALARGLVTRDVIRITARHGHGEQHARGGAEQLHRRCLPRVSACGLLRDVSTGRCASPASRRTPEPHQSELAASPRARRCWTPRGAHGDHRVSDPPASTRCWSTARSALRISRRPRGSGGRTGSRLPPAGRAGLPGEEAAVSAAGALLPIWRRRRVRSEPHQPLELLRASSCMELTTRRCATWS